MKRTPSSRPSGIRQFLIAHEWQIVAVAAAAAFALGFYGFKQVVSPGDPRGYFRIVTLAAQLFLLESNIGPGEGLNWPLVIAQILAPAVFGYTAVKAALVLFRDEIQSLRVPFWQNHIVICGLGQKGSRLVREYRREGKRVVVIEQDSECAGIAGCKRQGGVALIGNAANITTLQRAGAHRAKQVIAVSGDDGVNLEVGLELLRLKSGVRQRHQICCFLHVADTTLLPLVQTHALLKDPHDVLDVRLFNTSQVAARLLFEKHPLDYKPIVPGSEFRRAHLIVLGFGAVGESVVLQAARIGILATEAKTRISVIDAEAGQKEAAFLRRYPAFPDVADLEFHAMDLRSVDLIVRMQDWSKEQDELKTLAVCVQDNSLALSVALSITDAVDSAAIPVHVRLDRLHGLAALLADGSPESSLKARIHPFGMLDVTCTPEALEGGELDRMAAVIHERYRQDEKKKHPDTEDPATVKWAHLNPGLQDSNRQQADHVAVKLRAIGCFSALKGSREGQDFLGFTRDEVNLLARMEHRRWCAERLLAGWRYAPGERNISARTNPNLVAWEQLDRGVQDKDVQAVESIPEVLAKVGRVVRRAVSSGSKTG